MRIPGIVKCDLCGSEIKDLSRAITIAVPLTQELKDQIGAEIEKDMPAGFRALIPPRQMVPATWTIEACGCALSLLPMLKDAVAEDVKRNMQLRAEYRERRFQPIGSFEDL